MDIVTIADAIAVLSYLHKRELLCDKCGDKLATHEHVGSYHHRCIGCVSVNGRYTAYKVPNELERRICDALVRWNERNPPKAAGGDPGDAANRASNQGPQVVHSEHVGEVVQTPGQGQGLGQFYDEHEPRIAESRWMDCLVVSDDTGFTVHAWVCGRDGQLWHCYVVPELRKLRVATRLIERACGELKEYARPWPYSAHARVNPYLLRTKDGDE